MRNLTLSADWNDFSLFDDYEAALVEADLIPDELRQRLSEWNGQYRGVISPEDSGLGSIVASVAALDAVGRALAAELKTVFPDAQLRYASEALGEPANLGSAV
jgi:hypothetical protein